MSWRVVVISSRSKLELKLGYLVVRGMDGTKRIHLKEIGVLIIESTGISLTASLLEALWENKINVIFCDSRHLPSAQLLSLHGSHNSASRVFTQVSWSDEMKAKVWAYVIKAKIAKQAECLKLHDSDGYERLLSYIDNVKDGDISNREGHAAKVYFNALFGHDFFRDVDSKLNSALDYGYSIILAAVAREIVANGCITQIGIFHHNVFNSYNLASDLMEPFRPLVDMTVAGFSIGEISISKEERLALINILNDSIFIDGCKTSVMNGIKIYVASVLNALDNGDLTLIKMYDYAD